MTEDQFSPQKTDKIRCIVMHWTAGSHTVSELDRDHYHEIVGGDGTRVLGVFCPEDNLDLSNGQFARHTKDLHLGAVGLSMACMREAQERPLDVGEFKMTEQQLSVFCEMVAEYCHKYEVPITRETVLSHAEVQRTLSIKQAGKWDITVLPSMTYVGDSIEVGDKLRARIRKCLREVELA